MKNETYVPRRISRTRHLDVRGLPIQLREWDADGPPLLLLHGFLDASITFQFLVDAMTHDRRIIAPDWRGHGGSAWPPQGYWLHDYLADLDTIVDALSPDRPVDIVGHSLGGNLVTIFAGIRPQRVRRLASIDGFAMRDTPAQNAPERIGKWLDSLKDTPKERVYASVDEMADRLMAANRRLTRDKALFLAQNLARPVGSGVAFAFDPNHRRPFPTLHRLDEWAACWEKVEAQALWIAASDRFAKTPQESRDNFDGRLKHLRHGRGTEIPDTGHNIHHDAPEALARLLEEFLYR